MSLYCTTAGRGQISLPLCLQVIHLWFEEFSLEDTATCSADFVTLKDDLGILGVYGAKASNAGDLLP